MKLFKSKTQKIGKLGEDLACKYLKGKGFSILERNYTKKWGEIDVIAEKDGAIHFIEVKASARELAEKQSGVDVKHEENVSPETENFFRPEENVHPWKMKRIRRTIETYFLSKRIGNTPWQFDIFLVFLDLRSKRARVEKLENIVL